MRPANQFPASLPSGSSEDQHLPLAMLRQYVAGTLPGAEQHQVETHTLACARCADVLDGLAQTDLATTDQALTSLQARLQARLAEEAPEATPVVPMWPWRQLVAAVLLLLVGAGVWLGVRRSAQGPTGGPEVAFQQPTNQPSAAAAAKRAAPAPNAAEAPALAADKGAAVVAPQSPPQAAPSVAARSARARQLYAATATKAEESKQVESATADMAMKAEAVSGTAPAASVPSPGLAAADTVLRASQADGLARQEKQEDYAVKSAKKSKAMAAPVAAGPVAAPSQNALAGRVTSAAATSAGMRVVRGRVTDQRSGTALPGVTVLVEGTTIGASTAADGSFALVVPVAAKALTFSFIGYSSSSQPLPADDSALALTLAPDNRQLSEVVVVRRERPPAPVSIGALPAGGYKAFQEYLKTELEYPEKARQDGKSGTVKLRFTVAVDGSLQDIEVVRGLCEECDAEAIRLLKEGPKWYPAISKGRRTARPVEISVPFRVNE